MVRRMFKTTRNRHDVQPFGKWNASQGGDAPLCSSRVAGEKEMTPPRENKMEEIAEFERKNVSWIGQHSQGAESLRGRDQRTHLLDALPLGRLALLDHPVGRPAGLRGRGHAPRRWTLCPDGP